MISIDKSYEIGMSSSAFYQSEKDELLKLVKEKGESLHVFSRSMDSAVLVSAIPLVNGFVLTADGDIVSSERWMPLNGFNPKPQRQPIKPSIRFQVLKRDGYRCQMCLRFTSRKVLPFGTCFCIGTLMDGDQRQLRSRTSLRTSVSHARRNRFT